MVGGNIKKSLITSDGGTPNVTVLKGASTCFIKPKHTTHTGSNWRSIAKIFIELECYKTTIYLFNNLFKKNYSY